MAIDKNIITWLYDAYNFIKALSRLEGEGLLGLGVANRLLFVCMGRKGGSFRMLPVLI